MQTFGRLRILRAFERKHLPFLKTIEDFDLVREIGFHQEQGAPLSLKQLYLLGIGSVATIQRRLKRLKHLGVVHDTRSESDARSLQLTLSPKVHKTFAQYAALIARDEQSS